VKTDEIEANHDWILGVFDDLIAYAQAQSLDALVSQIIEMKEASRQEIEQKSVTTQGQSSLRISIPEAIFLPTTLN
jgi:hypothetical protein